MHGPGSPWARPGLEIHLVRWAGPKTNIGLCGQRLVTNLYTKVKSMWNIMTLSRILQQELKCEKNSNKHFSASGSRTRDCVASHRALNQWAKPERWQTGCKGHRYVDTVLSVSKISKCEYVPTYLHLHKCECTVPFTNITHVKSNQQMQTFSHQRPQHAIWLSVHVAAMLTNDGATCSTVLNEHCGKFTIRESRNIYAARSHSTTQAYPAHK